MSIPNSGICDFNIDCDGAEDELNCQQDGRFYCQEGNPLFVHQKNVRVYPAW